MHIMTDVGWQPLTPRCVNHNKLEGVFRPSTIEAARAECSARADRFNEANSVTSMMLKQEFFSGHQFLDKGHPPLLGAFGEKL